ncbi:MAG: hypothetical protein D6734_09910, partial [Candidatus Schekmanbacteria bacterium]
YFTQLKIDTMKEDITTAEKLFITPSSKIVKVMSLNQKALIADILWLKIIQYVGERKQTEKGWDWLYNNTNLLTDLDPNFYLAYQFSGLILTVFANRIDQSITILKKGAKYNPDNWFIYFLLGYNYFNEIRDYKKAAFYIRQASLVKGSPAFLKLFATRLYSSAGNPEDGIIFTESLLRKTENEEMKKRLNERLKLLYIERDLKLLNEKVKDYIKKFKTTPTSLQDLVKANLLTSIPKDPFGKEYYLDITTGTVKSASTTERLKVFHRH